MEDTMILEWIAKKKASMAMPFNAKIRGQVDELEQYLVTKGFSVIEGELKTPSGEYINPVMGRFKTPLNKEA